MVQSTLAHAREDTACESNKNLAITRLSSVIRLNVCVCAREQKHRFAGLKLSLVNQTILTGGEVYSSPAKIVVKLSFRGISSLNLQSIFSSYIY